MVRCEKNDTTPNDEYLEEHAPKEWSSAAPPWLPSGVCTMGGASASTGEAGGAAAGDSGRLDKYMQPGLIKALLPDN